MKNFQGPTPPEEFTDNGNSLPRVMICLKAYSNSRFPLAARWHDYAYHLLRAMWWALNDIGKNTEDGSLLFARMKELKKEADKNYYHNIHIENGGQYTARRWFCHILSRPFYRAVRCMGWRAIKGSGHLQNAELLKIEVKEVLAQYENTGV